VSQRREPLTVEADKLRDLLSIRGLKVPEKPVLRMCLDTLSRRSVDLVDAYLAALCASRQLRGVYSFDRNLRKLEVEMLAVE
jgi:predicted nucleic acid-binding protein